ncbi:E3 ubiquitin-protein ligase LRSAM1-like isoform X1 [Melitaea cinxia]|uniref:E3 ubiquitin-protein ligase LRSAM1-like isoform X1 n=1 Tax=Melitaea cinxia TaxID=113334 RepID=UPI001E272CBB|nr:E3 ubiquitin-protein ligase LRSAM1-like isoform X1 [Melitaea cinxia]
MGCAVSGIQRTMSLFSRNSNNSQDIRAKLERKLYLARESPEPDFNLSDCEMRRLPSGIFSICKVFRKDYLYLHNNRLQSLEDGGQLSDLQLIKVLNLSYNQFSYLPNDIRYLVSLTELYLQNNCLESLPDGIKYMECLQVLDVSNNKLGRLNPMLGNLKSLKILKISGNKSLNKLCPELCYAVNLVSIESDGENFIFPPPDIMTKSTTEIMKFLCLEMNIEYLPPLPTTLDISPSQIPSTNYNVFEKQVGITWEEQEAKMIEQENKIHRANQVQREKFLTNFLQEQQDLDSEIAKVQEVRDIERQKLMKTIQKDEQDIEWLVKNFIQTDRLKPEVIQQQLAYEQAEHNRLLEITRQNYDNVRRTDILTAMEQLIENDYHIQYHKKNYKDGLNNIKQSLLSQESEGTNKLVHILNAKDESRTVLIQQVLEDQDIQKAIVSSLLDRVDAKSWSLNQEISLISMHLARLSVIEQEKKKMQIEFNYNELLTQRLKLVDFLDDLLDQRKKRRKQLINTLKEAQDEGNQPSDFWLKSYQKLLDSAPKSLFNVRKLDPVFANYLLQEGVIHCLPFLAKYLFSGESLLNITHENLKESGVSLTSDRESILKALKLYVNEKSQNYNDADLNIKSASPNSPPLDTKQNCSGVLNVDEKESTNVEGECVICMDEKSEVVFVPCGHMCCCHSCAQNELEGCPMCRTKIERTIRVILS